jgi:septal ring factor EnvC (AmiA/AmiB activator)
VVVAVATVALLALLLAGPAPVRCAQGVEELKAAIEAKSERARAEEEALLRLTESEKRLHQDLTEAARRIDTARGRVAEQEKRLAAIQEREQAAQTRSMALTRDKKRAEAELARYLSGLWSLYLKKDVVHRGRDVPTWDKADREYEWTAEMYRKVDELLADLRRRQLEVRSVLAEQQRLASEARTQLAAVNRAKDEELRDKLAYMRRLSEVRREKLDREEELGRVMTAIKSLNYTLSLRMRPGDHPFGELKGTLPWPAQGRVVAEFAPDRRPPRHGMGLSVADGAPVRAVSWGKVVHNDVLRGFGRVVILMHGEEYYSLYAFLAESAVEVGQDVRQGDVLGRAGYYPDAKGPGLYFELRFHQKAINPKTWLIAAR